MRGLGLVALVLGGLGAVALGCNDPEVRYGPVGGLRVRGGGVDDGNACAYPPGTDETGNTCPSYTEVYEIFDRPDIGCTLGACHGEGSTFPPFMPAGDPQTAYDNMANYFSAEGRPYVAENAQDTAFILCNVWFDAPTQIGSPMPKGAPLVEGEDLTTIANWVACGMPRGDGGGVGGGGTGGALGTGAGGAGGSGTGGAGGGL